ncbi:hypothetical protein BDQ17DRAFT_1337671 [Cyathus striatus]|nr:hypothetical protein BDQ17DRAFT_1337671 [Cyathus striatus]
MPGSILFYLQTSVTVSACFFNESITWHDPSDPAACYTLGKPGFNGMNLPAEVKHSSSEQGSIEWVLVEGLIPHHLMESLPVPGSYMAVLDVGKDFVWNAVMRKTAASDAITTYIRILRKRYYIQHPSAVTRLATAL